MMQMRSKMRRAEALDAEVGDISVYSLNNGRSASEGKKLLTPLEF